MKYIYLLVSLLFISMVSANTKLTLIEDTANLVSQHEYKRYFYDCTEFSRDLKNILVKSNIKAQCVFGTYREDSSNIYHFNLHTWVEVNDKDLGLFYIEATGGYIIPNQTFNEHYKIVSKGWCA